MVGSTDGIFDRGVLVFQDTPSGLVAAAMISIVPGYISRSVAGSYDNEGIAIFCMLLTYYMWIKAVKTGSISWAALCGLAYFYMVRSNAVVSKQPRSTAYFQDRDTICNDAPPLASINDHKLWQCKHSFCDRLVTELASVLRAFFYLQACHVIFGMENSGSQFYHTSARGMSVNFVWVVTQLKKIQPIFLNKKEAFFS